MTPPVTVLIVEDEQDIQELIRFNLNRAGYLTVSARTGQAALAAIQMQPPALILLDLMLPDLSGIEICRRINADPDTRQLPIIMLTARGEEQDVVRGLAAGADDYLTKPFSPAVLVARIDALLRRSQQQPKTTSERLSSHDIAIDPGRHQATYGGRLLSLTLTEFIILRLLVSRPGQVFPRRQIIAAIQGRADAVSERSVDVQVVALRRKLGDASHLIETVRGVGYRLQSD